MSLQAETKEKVKVFEQAAKSAASKIAMLEKQVESLSENKLVEKLR